MPEMIFTTEAMHVTELAIHKMLGMQVAPPNDEHILVLPESPLVLNHLGTVHAGVQFILAEACSGEFLLRHFGNDPRNVFAVLRTANVKFRKPAQGELRASAKFLEKSGASLTDELASRGRAFVSVLVEVSDANLAVTMRGQYDWFLQRQSDTL
jgi:acyl-coenzyme A thioesterase PaaI-like protein